MSQSNKESLLEDYLAWQQRRLKEALINFKNSNQDPFGLLYDLYLYNWLQREVVPVHKKTLIARVFPKIDGELAGLLTTSWDNRKYLQGIIAYWLIQKQNLPRKESLEKLLASHNGQVSLAVAEILANWQKLAIFVLPKQEAISQIKALQKKRGSEVAGELDKKRVALVDGLPEKFNQSGSLSKIGVIPHMGCAQECRHCMFVWRQPIRDRVDPVQLFDKINLKTESVLFTGGDLDKHMGEFYQAISYMEDVNVFAILLNGAFATTLKETQERFLAISEALQKRVSTIPRAKVVLQISFDEYHQEIISDEKGELRERIPVANIANLIMASLNYHDIQLVLLHKQNRLNFSDNLIKVGLFARLNRTLTEMG
ncbi:MAG: hypothetical protein HQL69_24465, partial [Magnetococcales bacterium]|nr:hypothetical protein [Magnetococcales bacterium]